MSALADYLTDPSRGLNWIQDWQPVAEPDQLAEVGGFSFDYDQPSYQLPLEQFIGTSMVNIWSVLPGDAKGAMAGAVSQIMAAVTTGSAMADSIGNVMGGVMSGIGSMAPYATATVEWAQWIVAFSQGVQKANDQRRYEGRLASVQLLKDSGPALWAGNNYFTTRYTRRRAGKSNVSNMVWPPDPRLFNGLMPPIPRSGDGCGGTGDNPGGHSNNAPKASNCEGSFSLYPIYMPLFDSRRAYGKPGVTAVMRKGMERATGGGALIWETMSEMQMSILADPAFNIFVNAEDVYSALMIWKQTYWDPALDWFQNGEPYGYSTPSDPTKYQVRIDPEFDPDNPGYGFYYTPGRLIGAYTPFFTGSLSDEQLDDTINLEGSEHLYSPYGGNGWSFSNYNTLLTATAQFLNTRAALLRRRSFCQMLVDEGTVDLVTEPGLAAAIYSSAAGDAPPPLMKQSGPGGGGMKLQTTPIKTPSSRKKSGSGLVVVGGAAAVAFFMSKR